MKWRSAIRMSVVPLLLSLASASVACGGGLIPFKGKPPAPPVAGLPPPAPPPPPLPPFRAQVVMAATSDVNPDASGRPSPVVIRVYQLKDDAAFRSADYFPLFDDEQKTLGADLLSRKEYVLAPAEQRRIEVELALDAKFVGVLAAYRDIRNAQWRAVLPTARKDFGVAIGRARVELTAAE